MRPSRTQFDPSQPCWTDYLPFLNRLKAAQNSTCEQLNSLLPGGLSSESGHLIRFVPSTELEEDGYERRIYNSGQVSTRRGNWHDLFNALVWMRFPRIKRAMNALHYHALQEQTSGSRGPLRDALTLFDECGAMVISHRKKRLNAFATRHWVKAFDQHEFQNDVQLAISGHAMLEKYLSPYKSMTAKALLIMVEPKVMLLSREKLLSYLDRGVAAQLLAGNILTKPACLAPLPMAGIPGWWPLGVQDDEFYADQHVFRPPPARLVPAAVAML